MTDNTRHAGVSQPPTTAPCFCFQRLGEPFVHDEKCPRHPASVEAAASLPDTPPTLWPERSTVLVFGDWKQISETPKLGRRGGVSEAPTVRHPDALVVRRAFCQCGHLREDHDREDVCFGDNATCECQNFRATTSVPVPSLAEINHIHELAHAIRNGDYSTSGAPSAECAVDADLLEKLCDAVALAAPSSAPPTQEPVAWAVLNADGKVPFVHLERLVAER